eukprot:TRINITY_DN4748_c0_g1_i5.p1 TRINITY_DN4748_c0_g1~~TRINITY_DN4748_c0_g1_i5.p1  ORF type:complete len:283 (+),score=109.93 TRINITY_DN4748_c0_g1_i5:83-850(+)
MSQQCDYSASEACAVSWFHPCCPGYSAPYFGDFMPDLSGGAPAMIVPAGADTGRSNGRSSQAAPQEEESAEPDSAPTDDFAADRVRPCCHNEWVKEGKKRGRLQLRCQVCRAMWKTRPEAHEKCHAFYCGRCKLGDECPRPHIYARQRKAAAQRDVEPQAADEGSAAAEEPTVAAVPVALDGDEERTVMVLATFSEAQGAAAAPVSTFMPWHVPAEPTDGAEAATDAAYFLPKRDDSLFWDPSDEPTEFDTSAFY